MPTLNINTMSKEQLMARIQELETAKVKAITLKVSEKGAISVYGLGRFPVTLYRSQMERLLDKAPEIMAFIKANAETLTTKD